MKRNTLHIRSFILSFFMLLTILFGSWGAFAYAEETESALDLDGTEVISDLTGGVIDGKNFDITDYAFGSSGKTTVFSVLEYCYAFRESEQDNYGLYVYVHNPTAVKFVGESELNNITLATAKNPEHYDVYPLKFLNNSSTEYKGLFYKYKVVLTDDQKKNILSSLNSAERLYNVAEINLLVEGETNAQPIIVEKKFYYKGYAAGYGFDPKDESTLSCFTDRLDVISLECHPTTFRPAGTNGKNDYTQDSLHSVYFTLPKKFVSSYGKMVGAKGRFKRATLAPFLVTGNQEAYNAILPYLGKGIIAFTPLDYCYLGAYREVEPSGSIAGRTQRFYGYTYNAWFDDDDYTNYRSEYGYQIEVLRMMFYSGKGTDSADNYTVRSEDILSFLKESKTKYGGELVSDKYSRRMFSAVDNDYTVFDIHTGDERFEDTEYDLTNTLVSRSWWDKLWGLRGTEYTENFNGLKGIEQITDVSGTAEEVAKRYYISKADYDDFKGVYNKGVRYNGDDMYLLRYDVSDYISQEATCFKESDNSLPLKIDTNAYFAQEDVHLDFEIIDITMYNGEYHVIPVAMKPIDVIPAATPPVYTKSDSFWDPSNWLMWLLIAVASVVLLIVLLPFLPTILSVVVKVIVWVVKAVFWIVALPFRGIAALIRTIKEHREDRK